MSTTADLVIALKKELKNAQMTYADLAQALGMAESSVKRMLAKGDMPLSRIDAICRALALDFADLARRVADEQPLLKELTQEQEKAVVADLVIALKKELKNAQMTYADLAQALGMAESSVKRMLAKGDMPLSRIDAICRALALDFADLARRVADEQPLLKELTQEQEKAVVADKKLLLMAICVLSQWTLEQVVATYRLTEAEGIKYLAQLDRIGIIELRPLNRYRLKLAKTFRWRPHGPVMHYFRDNALLDYFAGGFDGPGEGVLLVHGSISRALAPAFQERMQRVAQDFAQQHLADQKLPLQEREGYTVLLAMRSWEFEAFASMRRTGA